MDFLCFTFEDIHMSILSSIKVSRKGSS